MQSILMVGEQRSGSNLLRLILNSSSEIVAPHPPHILQNLMPLMPDYGDLSDEDTMNRLVDDVCRLVEHNPVVWDKIKHFDRDEVRSLCGENSLVAVFSAVMEIYAHKHNAKAWLCKSMQNIRWAKELDDYLDNAKFIYLYRDPRDVALSFSKAVIGDKHPYNIATKWVQLQQLCLDAEKWLRPDQFKRVCYEALTSEPEDTISDLCTFLDIPFIPDMLNFHRSGEASRTATKSSLWSNLTQPVMAGNSNKFKKNMSEQHVRIIESIAGNIMDQLGYSRYIVEPGKEESYSRKEIDQFNAENDSSMKSMSKKTDPEDLRRRQRQLSIIQEIRDANRYPQMEQIATR